MNSKEKYYIISAGSKREEFNKTPKWKFLKRMRIENEIQFFIDRANECK